MKRLYISNKISNDLALRNNAIQFFKNIDKNDSQEVIVDFSNVNTITRSFADEYQKRKNNSKKNIKEENIPLNVQKMFEIVNRIKNTPSIKTIS